MAAFQSVPNTPLAVTAVQCQLLTSRWLLYSLSQTHPSPSLLFSVSYSHRDGYYTVCPKHIPHRHCCSVLVTHIEMATIHTVCTKHTPHRHCCSVLVAHIEMATIHTVCTKHTPHRHCCSVVVCQVLRGLPRLLFQLWEAPGVKCRCYVIIHLMVGLYYYTDLSPRSAEIIRRRRMSVSELKSPLPCLVVCPWLLEQEPTCPDLPPQICYARPPSPSLPLPPTQTHECTHAHTYTLTHTHTRTHTHARSHTLTHSRASSVKAS